MLAKPEQATHVGLETQECDMADPQIRLDQMVVKLKEQGYRLTPQRLAVLKILSGSNEHPSAEQIYDQVKVDFPMTSLATVYKTVTLLKEMGEVWELGFSDDSNHYDGNKPYPHPHVICVRCRRIVDPEIDHVELLAVKASEASGFQVLNYRLDFFGICPGCQREA
jgi:Fur family peroxide stress response transcriptional regulator